MREGDFTDVTPFLLGDVVISVDTAEREAKFSGIQFGERFLQLLVHGILHLFGFDHEDNHVEAARMEAKNDEIMSKIHIDCSSDFS